MHRADDQLTFVYLHFNHRLKLVLIKHDQRNTCRFKY